MVFKHAYLAPVDQMRVHLMILCANIHNVNNDCLQFLSVNKIRHQFSKATTKHLLLPAYTRYVMTCSECACSLQR